MTTVDFCPLNPVNAYLQARGVKAWVDETELLVGDSLRRSLDRGMVRSRFGVVVLSPDLFAKPWAQHELDGLVTKEIDSKRKVVLPIWHNVGKEEVASHSPSLADKVAIVAGDKSIVDVVSELQKVLKRDR